MFWSCKRYSPCTACSLPFCFPFLCKQQTVKGISQIMLFPSNPLACQILVSSKSTAHGRGCGSSWRNFFGIRSFSNVYHHNWKLPRTPPPPQVLKNKPGIPKKEKGFWRKGRNGKYYFKHKSWRVFLNIGSQDLFCVPTSGILSKLFSWC